MDEVILHHYPQSPVSEKVRVALGLKGLAWHSVIIPRLPPKPDLMPLTGGYRRAPVMQIGADIYCDSQCILRELERRYPEPGFFPDGENGLVWSLSRWTDGELLDVAVRLVLGASADSLSPEFARDRGRLYLGPEQTVQDLQSDLPHLAAQLRGAFSWLEQSLQRSGAFVMGAEAGLADALFYYLVWFLRTRWPEATTFLSQFPALETWEGKLRDLGHGRMETMESAAALVIAARGETQTPECDDPDDPQGLRCGQRVGVVPSGDGGDPVVYGPLRYADRETIAIMTRDQRAGDVCVHFPRVGYQVNRAPE